MILLKYHCQDTCEFKQDSGQTVYRTYYYFVEEGTEKELYLFENKKFNLWIGGTSENLSDLQCFKLIEKDGDNWKFERAEYEITQEGYILIKSDVKNEFFHRMVVFAFGDKYAQFQDFKSDETIDHINGDKMRNSIDNLEVIPNIVNLYRAFKNNYNGARERFFNTLANLNLEEFKKATINLYKEINKKEGS